MILSQLLFRVRFRSTPGRVHDATFTLFDENELCSDAIRQFSETGVTSLLDEQVQGRDGVLDAFHTRNVEQGVGEEWVTVVADERHDKVRKTPAVP